MTVDPAVSTQPPPSQTARVLDTVRTLPRWALVLIVGGSGLLVWWMIKNYQGGASESWTEQATALLTSRGYSQDEITNALNHYFRGGMTTQDQEIIAEAIRALGTPDLPNTSSNVSPVSPVTPSGMNNSTTPIPGTPDGVAYWHVVSMGVGWSSSFRGLAQQFYGDPNKGVVIQQVNPGITTNDYQRIPVGTAIKIPRSV